MIDESTFGSLILTNTIVAAVCIVIVITLFVFFIAFLVSLIRRRWFGNNEKNDNKIADLFSLNCQ